MVLVDLSMKTAVGRHEFKRSGRRMDAKDATSVVAVVSDVVFLTQIEEGKNVGNARLIKIHVDIAKIRLLGGKLGSVVAVNPDGFRCWADIRDMVRVTKQIDGGLTV